MKKPPFIAFLLLLLSATSTPAQYWMQQAITERVALWLRVQDGNWDPDPCTFDAEDLETGVFQMSSTPIELPGCKATQVYRVVVNPRALVNLQQETRLLDCSHTEYHQVTLAVAVHTPQTTELKAGEARVVQGAPALAVISGPIFTNSEYDWAGPSITALQRAQARLYYLDPVDVRPGKSTRAYTAFRAHAQALHTQVEIRFDPANADRFAIYALGREARCIKSWDDAAEE
jgi:hypothetical protein